METHLIIEVEEVWYRAAKKEEPNVWAGQK
jgi:hypothetical protein